MIGPKIAALRKQRGMRQKDLAKYVGVCEDYISMIERGKRTPARKTLIRIALILEVSLEELMK